MQEPSPSTGEHKISEERRVEDIVNEEECNERGGDEPVDANNEGSQPKTNPLIPKRCLPGVGGTNERRAQVIATRRLELGIIWVTQK